MTTSALRVIQITDCHLTGRPGARLHGWDNRAALDAVVEHVRRTYPRIDVLLLTGDLAHDETEAGYRHLASAVAPLGAARILAMPGNHDDPSLLETVFPDAGPISAGGWRLHALNSRIAGEDRGRLGPAALAALAADLDAHPRAPALVAAHHPPVPVGTAWLDAMRLADGDALIARLRRHASPTAVVGGHVHQFHDSRHDSVRVLTTPAVTRQFRPGSATFAEDRRRTPGYRTLRLFRDGRLTTRVHRVPDAADCAHNCG